MQVVHTRYCTVAWSSSLHSIGSGSQVYGSLLEEFPKSHGDTVDDVHYFSSITDGLSKRTCCEDASCISRVAGKSIFPWLSSPITTVIRRVYRWHPMRHYMGGHVDLRFVGQRWERAPPLVRILLESPLRMWILYGSVFSWIRAGRRVTLTDDNDFRI